MTIKEKGYVHWNGELKQDRFPWRPMTKNGIRLTLKKRFFKFFLFLSFIPSVVYLAGIYASERLEDFSFLTRDSDAVQFLQVNPKYFSSYFTSDYLLFMLVMIMVFCGSGLISDDLRYNSLQLYFSRPITKRDYFFGKGSILVFFILAITLVPGLILLLGKILFSASFGFIGEYPWLIFSIIGYSVVLTAFFSLYALFLSAINKNRRYVGIMIFGLYFFSDILFGIFYGIFRHPYFSLFSIKNNLQQVGAFLFQQKQPHNVPWYLSLLVISAICLISILVLKRRVRGVEVVK